MTQIDPNEIDTLIAQLEQSLNEAMLADLIDNVFKGRKFKLHLIDPSTGEREEKEIGG